MMPRQKPGLSKQDYQTPPEFLSAVRHYLNITDFVIDLAAEGHNAVCPRFHTTTGLIQPWYMHLGTGEWAWLNPPFGRIGPWVKKAASERRWLSNFAGIAVLVPASTGANWWRDHVHMQAHVLLLNGRLTFVGHMAPYPKDCALLLYCLHRRPRYEVWNWRQEGSSTSESVTSTNHPRP